MSDCRLLLASIALGVVTSAAVCDDTPAPKEPTIDEDKARLIGEWDFKPGGAENERLKVKGTFKVTFEKDGKGAIVHTQEDGFTSHGFNWAITEVKGRGRVIVLLGNGPSAAIQYDFISEKDKPDQLVVWTGQWGMAFTFLGEWRKLPVVRK